MYSLTIKIPLYKVTIYVKIAPDIKKVINNFCKKKKWKDIELKEDEDVYGYAVSSTTAEGNYFIFYDEKHTTFNYLTHEVSHVVDYILEEKEIETTGEARAYLTGHISEKIFDFVLKKGLLISKYLPKQEPKPINVEKDEKPGELLQEVHSNP
jgi:ribosome maturation protein Sdo1